MRIHKRFLFITLCGLLLGVTVGCDPAGITAANPGDQDHAASPGAADSTESEARLRLSELPVGTWRPMTNYSRDRFPHWRSQGHGCDTRETVLKQQGTDVVTNSACKAVEGTWVSVYDGKTVTDASDLDIDHMVPLANAWRTGAADWTDEERSDFANDLTRPQLFAVTASQNRSKGDQDPSEWRPASQDFWCEYAEDWIAVKSYWRLFVTEEEKTALTEMLGTC